MDYSDGSLRDIENKNHMFGSKVSMAHTHSMRFCMYVRMFARFPVCFVVVVNFLIDIVMNVPLKIPFRGINCL